ncbi:hypothetical protein NB622_21165 [Vibrio parahaemolyticus]|uniref:PglD-related sugar-binding protein n=1 Tax=Vibrio parahaemolyticus TaxID=670 RepID=UPI001A8D8927|nr:hypothetical protein [Vibrio parahaemolyticus]EJB8540138.1 hypothetical protein [Vibrio parahaemolyticus]MBO0186757.1 hypothetical protein [Vibrio parahaemolyticus]MBO0218250.1 hypothetical protein [Vibrio parahaemolyticus]MBY4624000.1 hypothetical protein [Vibrio parahaemolyticus]MCR9736827.1 hypothetical protein [Vibrio parahaemolyticus]
MRKIILYGAKGLGKELLNNIDSDFEHCEVVFFDGISTSDDKFIADNYKIIKDKRTLIQQNNTPIIVAVGGSENRRKIHNELTSCGFQVCGYVAKDAKVGKLDNVISPTTTILSGTNITMSVVIGVGVLINKNVTISHDVRIGDFCEVSPGATILGRASIGAGSEVGAGAIILPNVTVGCNCKIGAGSVVTKDVENNTVVAGVPARTIRKL